MKNTPSGGALVREASEHIPYRAEVVRKLLHLMALVVPLAMALVGKAWALYLLAPLAALALTLDVLRVRSAWWARHIGLVFGFMMRRSEQPPVGGPVAINGATWVLVSALVLTFLFPVRVAAVGFSMFMVADAAAALVGRRWGRTLWGRGPRTVEGSAAFVAVGLAMAALLPGVVFWVGAVAAVVAAAAEAPPGPLDDNIRVPLAAAATIFLLERFVLGIPLELFL